MVAVSSKGVIGRDGGLPWHLPEDLRRFRRLTTGYPVIVGRRTHEAIVRQNGHPLGGRLTVVVSGTLEPPPGPVLVAPDVPRALRAAAAVAEFAGLDEVFVAGGATVYAQAMPVTDRVYLTRVLDDTVDGDVRMNDGWLDGFRPTAVAELQVHAGTAYVFEQHDRA